jgi:hypothetical protein
VPEGRDEDGDGEVDEDPPGTDLARNFAGAWDEPGPWRGDGPFPSSAPETQALMEWSFSIPSLLAWVGLASEGPRVERASERGADADADDALYAALFPGGKAANGLAVRKASERPGAADNRGSDLDWAARHLGVVAWRVPVWRIAKEERNARPRDDADELDWLLWNDRVLGGAGFVPWKAVKHPQWGEVEVGGWRPFTRHEPPPPMLPDAVAGVAPAVWAAAALAPRLEVRASAERLSAEIVRVRARAANTGGGPTETRCAQAARRAHEVRLTLAAAPGVEVLAGPRAAGVGVLAAGGLSAQVEWIVRRAGPGPVGRVVAAHRVAGAAEQALEAP